MGYGAFDEMYEEAFDDGYNKARTEIASRVPIADDIFWQKETHSFHIMSEGKIVALVPMDVLNAVRNQSPTKECD